MFSSRMKQVIGFLNSFHLNIIDVVPYITYNLVHVVLEPCGMKIFDWLKYKLNKLRYTKIILSLYEKAIS